MEFIDFAIEKVGLPGMDSPLKNPCFERENAAVAYSRDPDMIVAEQKAFGKPLSMEKAGPRAEIFHKPETSAAGILTAGGLCPGLNDVIKGLTNTLYLGYGVKKIWGVRYGYRGLTGNSVFEPLPLDPDVVDEIHTQGGTILGSSRGEQDIAEMVDTLVDRKINLMFCVGGDGTLRGARRMAEEVQRRNLPISVVGVPKTIDNDISFTERSFGFETAIYATNSVIDAAHNEAKGAFNGVGLIKVMGRDSGFIAAYATLANSNVNYCLIPEMSLALEGGSGFLPHLRKRLEAKQHAVVMVAEGAGQAFFGGGDVKDASGNIIHKDIGLYLKMKIAEFAKKESFEVNIKYFDPSYMIRSLDAHGTDGVFCLMLAQNAVHAAMTGRTNMVVGYCNGEFTHVPLALATRERKKLDINGPIWRSVLSVTTQPDMA